MKSADITRMTNLILFAILLVIQIGAVYYLYTLQQNTACTCAHTTELVYLVAISVVNLVLMVVQPADVVGSIHLQVITTFVGLFATFAFAVLGYQYLQKLRGCGCARTESLEHHLFRAAVFVRILSASLFVAAFVIGFVYGFIVAVKKGVAGKG